MGPSFISFSLVFGVLLNVEWRLLLCGKMFLCLNYFLPHPQKFFGLWIESLVVYASAIVEKNQTSSPKSNVFVSNVFFFIGVGFWNPAETFVYTSSTVAKGVSWSGLRVASSSFDPHHWYLVPVNSCCCGSRRNCASDSLTYLFRLVNIFTWFIFIFGLRFHWPAELISFMGSPLWLSNHILTWALVSRAPMRVCFLPPTPLQALCSFHHPLLQRRF